MGAAQSVETPKPRLPGLRLGRQEFFLLILLLPVPLLPRIGQSAASLTVFLFVLGFLGVARLNDCNRSPFVSAGWAAALVGVAFSRLFWDGLEIYRWQTWQIAIFFSPCCLLLWTVADLLFNPGTPDENRYGRRLFGQPPGQRPSRPYNSSIQTYVALALLMLLSAGALADRSEIRHVVLGAVRAVSMPADEEPDAVERWEYQSRLATKGKVALQAGRTREAEERFEDALALSFHDLVKARVLRLKAQGQTLNGDFEAALGNLHRSIILNPRSADSFELLGQLLQQFGDARGAADAYLKATWRRDWWSEDTRAEMDRRLEAWRSLGD